MNLLKQEIKYAKTSESDSLTGIIARFNELETVVKNYSIPDVVGRSEQLPCERCKKLEFMIENGLGWKDMENDCT